MCLCLSVCVQSHSKSLSSILLYSDRRKDKFIMKSTVIWVLFGAIFLFGESVTAWGGLFNRFSPELLANMGYGSHGGMHPFYETDNQIEETMGDDDPCYGKPCTANEHCCSGSVCVYVDGVSGTCLFLYGRKLGELCRHDADCESGLVCDVSASSGSSVCRAPMAIAKQYAEECGTSSDCDISRGLCCQLQRRHRMALRKVCSYFKDPLTCVGTVATDMIKHEVQHTAGEKRITNAFKHNLI